jgi:hypothetical protein
MCTSLTKEVSAVLISVKISAILSPKSECCGPHVSRARTTPGAIQIVGNSQLLDISRTEHERISTVSKSPILTTNTSRSLPSCARTDMILATCLS